MKVKFDFDEPAAVRFDRLLAERQRRVTNLAPAHRAIADDFHDLEDAVFHTQGRLLTGSGWRSLSPKWKAMKARRGLSTRILEMASGGQMGRLRRSLVVPGAPWQVLRLRGDSVEVGTSLSIAKIHQTGGVATVGQGPSRRSVRIPRRRFVSLRRVDKARWLAIYEQHLFEGRIGARRAA